MRLSLAIAALALVATACSSSEPTPTGPLVLLTHDSFVLSDSVLEQFTEETGIEVEIVTAGDAGEVVNTPGGQGTPPPGPDGPKPPVTDPDPTTVVVPAAPAPALTTVKTSETESYTTVGDVTRAPAGARSFYFRVTGREASVRLVEADGRIVGFNMLGSRWEHTFFERWIEERRTLDEVVARLHEAQFDVEFGRLDLAPLRAEFRRWRSQQS